MSAESGSTPGRVACLHCGRLLPAGEVLQIDDHIICAQCKPIALQQLREGVVLNSGTQLRYAGFWIRGAAMIFDFIVLYPFGVVLRLAAGQGWPEASGFTDTGAFTPLDLLLLTVETAVNVAYFTLLTGRYGATLGKRLFKLRVVMADGRPVSYWRALARSLAYYVSALPVMLGFLVAASNREKRALHDQLCGTRVVHWPKGRGHLPT